MFPHFSSSLILPAHPPLHSLSCQLTQTLRCILVFLRPCTSPPFILPCLPFDLTCLSLTPSSVLLCVDNELSVYLACHDCQSCTVLYTRVGEEGGGWGKSAKSDYILNTTNSLISSPFFFGFAFVSSFLTQCQHHHVQVIRRWCQRSHPPPDVRRGTRVSQHQRQLQVLCCQSGRLGRQEARVGAIGKTWL